MSCVTLMRKAQPQVWQYFSTLLLVFWKQKCIISAAFTGLRDIWCTSTHVFFFPLFCLMWFYLSVNCAFVKITWSPDSIYYEFTSIKKKVVWKDLKVHRSFLLALFPASASPLHHIINKHVKKSYCQITIWFFQRKWSRGSCFTPGMPAYWQYPNGLLLKIIFSPLMLQKNAVVGIPQATPVPEQ